MAFDNAEALKMLDADDLDLDLTDLRISAVNEAMRAEMKVLCLCLCSCCILSSSIYVAILLCLALRLAVVAHLVASYSLSS